MRAYVTGATGFAGSHLVDWLIGHGHEVFALVHAESGHQSLPNNPKCTQLLGDILDAANLKKSVLEVNPDAVFHLAGQASPGHSWLDPAKTFEINTIGTANILKAALQAGRPRTLIVTSSHIFGDVGHDSMPIDEDLIPSPKDPYGISKWAAGQLATLFWRRYELPVIEARPFNHIGPRQARGFVVPDFASQLAAIKVGQAEPLILVGNLDIERDFTDVRDVVRAYYLLVEGGRPGEAYHICSGYPVSIREILMTLIDLSGLSVRIEMDPTKQRRSEAHRIYGTFSKLAQDTGWRPEIDLKKSLFDALSEWVQRAQYGKS